MDNGNRAIMESQNTFILLLCYDTVLCPNKDWLLMKRENGLYIFFIQKSSTRIKVFYRVEGRHVISCVCVCARMRVTFYVRSPPN